MGTGANVQARLLALHHLDAPPWRPADVEQREGRILRQGNLNPEVQIYRYVTEESFDAYLFQTLETKAKFIAQVMMGESDLRRNQPLGSICGRHRPAWPFAGQTVLSWLEISLISSREVSRYGSLGSESTGQQGSWVNFVAATVPKTVLNRAGDGSG